MISAKKTKIVCTIGPVTSTEKVLSDLLKAGMNVMRMNFSHGDFKEHQERLNNFKSAMENTGMPGAILQDLGGPKIRIGEFGTETGRVTLVPGKFITLTTEKIIGDENRVSCNYANLAKEVKVGDAIFLDDGKKKLQVVEIKGSDVKCKIIAGGDTKSKRGVNLPDSELSISSLTEKDLADLEFGIKNKVDFIALSFVRRPSDITELREILDKRKCKAGIIAKIETPQAVACIDEIIELVDGIMVARGDLAIEVPAERVPLIQKSIIRKCNEAGKMVITATQMMESMIKTPVPTRAEVSDVANAILDGTDAVMLSEETTLGDFPIETVTMMSKVAHEIENREIENGSCFDEDCGCSVSSTVTMAAVDVAESMHAKLILALTEYGTSSALIASHRSFLPVIVATPNKETYNKSNLAFGCKPILVEKVSSFEEALTNAKAALIKEKLAKKGDKIVVVSATPFVKTKESNIILVETL